MNVSRSVMTVTLLLSVAAAWAQTPATPVVASQAKGASPIMQRRNVDPAVASNMMAKTGGILHTPVSGPSVLFLNTQQRVPAEVVRSAPTQIGTLLRLPFRHANTPSQTPVADAVRVLADTNIAAVVVIGDAAGYPALLVAPESRWALVNVAALSDNNVPQDLLIERTRKEILRAFGYLMGAAHSNFEGCLMKPVTSLADLDALSGKGLSPETLNKFLAQAKKLGMSQSRLTTYRKAVEEGWAPSPTNDIQRAIWQDVKSDSVQ